MKKTIFIVLGLTVVGLVYFLTNESKEKNVSQTKTQEVVERQEKNAEKQFPEVEKKQSNVLEKKHIAPGEFTVSPKEEEKMILAEFRRTLPEMLKDMQGIPQCLDKSNETQEAFECYKNLDLMFADLSNMLNLGEVDYNESSSKLTWNSDMKSKMLGELREEETSFKKIKTCIKDISTVSELKKCLDIRKKN